MRRRAPSRSIPGSFHVDDTDMRIKTRKLVSGPRKVGRHVASAANLAVGPGCSFGDAHCHSAPVAYALAAIIALFVLALVIVFWRTRKR